MNDFNSFLNSLNPDIIKKAQEFASSKKGEELISKLSGKSKDELFRKASSLTEEDKNALMKKIQENPDIIHKLKEML